MHKIQSNDMNILIEGIKSSKCEHFLVFLNSEYIVELYGMNADCAYLYEISQDSFHRDGTETIFGEYDQLVFYISKNDIDAGMPIFAGLSEYFEVVPEKSYITNPIGIEHININQASNPDYRNILEYMRKLILFSKNLKSNIQYQIDIGDITNTPEIQTMLSNRVTDPSIVFKVGNFLMTIYKGIVPMAKADKVSLKIYPFPDVLMPTKRFGAEFMVYKKKNIKIVITIYYINLI